jgi:hypothetical protein
MNFNHVRAVGREIMGFADYTMENPSEATKDADLNYLR